MTDRVAQGDLLHLAGLFQAGRHRDMEAAASALAAQCPGDGQAWKALGLALQVQGKDARAMLERAAALLPQDADVACGLGAVHAAAGELDAAAAAYQRALQSHPDHAHAHSNLGDVLARQGQWQRSEQHCRQALRLQPGMAAAYLNLGNALRGSGRLDEAVASYRRAVGMQPRLAQAHAALGIALKEQGDLPAAIRSLQLAVQLRPHAATHDQLGVALHLAGELAAALPCWASALRLEPGLAAAHHHQANALVELGRLDEAVASYHQALAHAPGDAEVHVNLSAALMDLSRPQEAETVLRQALVLQPDLAGAHMNLGNACAQQGRWNEALAHHRRAVALAPAMAQAHDNLAHALKTVGQPQAALAHLQRALELEPEDPARHSAVLFAMQYLADDAQVLVQALAAARRFGVLATRRARPSTAWTNAPDVERCLRVGLLSPDLRQHPVGYFVESVLATWAREAAGRLEVWAYDADGRRPGVEADATAQRLHALVTCWRQVGDFDDAALAQTIRRDGVDVLIDLSGHTYRNRLPVLAWRAAPVQVSWLGSCATTGLAEVDAVIADPWIVPDGTESAFAEPVVRLPETFLCFTPPPFDLPVAPLPALAHGRVQFGCCNHIAKMGDAVVERWAAVLRTVPGSGLTLQSQALHDPAVQRQVWARYAAHGIAADRLLLLPAQPRADYLAGYGAIDIALDPFPYPGGTTTAEALWMGVPVLTLGGATALSRQGVSLLRNVGLDEWIAADADDYVRLAVLHAGRMAALADLRAGLRARLLQSPVCDAPRFACNLEALLRARWRDWCARPAGSPQQT